MNDPYYPDGVPIDPGNDLEAVAAETIRCGCCLEPVDDQTEACDLCSEATGAYDGTGWRIHRCPLHDAASELADALEAIRAKVVALPDLEPDGDVAAHIDRQDSILFDIDALAAVALRKAGRGGSCSCPIRRRDNGETSEVEAREIRYGIPALMTTPTAHVPAWEAHPEDPLPSHGAIPLTPSRAWCSGVDAANMQMRKACRKEWNDDDWNLAVETQARLLKHLGHPWSQIAADMLEERP